MIEAGQMALDTFIEKQSVWVGQLVQQYRGATLAQAAADAGLPAVRRTDAAAHGQERRVLVLLARYPDCRGTLPIESPTGRRSAPRKRAAPRPDAAPATSLAARQTSRTRDSKARVSSQRVPRLPAIGQRGEKVIAPRIAPAAIPLIGCLASVRGAS